MDQRLLLTYQKLKSLYLNTVINKIVRELEIQNMASTKEAYDCYISKKIQIFVKRKMNMKEQNFLSILKQTEQLNPYNYPNYNKKSVKCSQCKQWLNGYFKVVYLKMFKLCFSTLHARFLVSAKCSFDKNHLDPLRWRLQSCPEIYKWGFGRKTK